MPHVTPIPFGAKALAFVGTWLLMTFLFAAYGGLTTASLAVCFVLAGILNVFLYTRSSRQR